MKTLDCKKLEKILKGTANHWRLRILFLVADSPNLSLFDITDRLGGNFKTISEHTKKLVASDLLEKRYKGQIVLHKVSATGSKILSQIKNLL